MVRDLGPFILAYILLSNPLKMRRYVDINPVSCSVTVWDFGRSVTVLDCEIAPLFGRKGTDEEAVCEMDQKSALQSFSRLHMRTTP